MNLTAAFGLVFAGLAFALIIGFHRMASKLSAYPLREITAFTRLKSAVGSAVEAGTRIHLSLGSGGLIGEQSAPALVGLSVLRRIASDASLSDNPPLATSGDGALMVLSQDAQRSAYLELGAEGRYDPTFGRLTGLTPFAYAAGTLPVIFDEQVSANVLLGHFGPELALIADAAERSGSPVVAGTSDVSSQAVLYAAVHEPLIGEEVFAGGAYLQVDGAHEASLRAQDILRWLVVALILAGSVIKLAGVDRFISGILR